MTLEELKIVISVQTDGLRKEMDQVKKQLGGLQNETNKTTSGMKNIFKKLVDGISALGIGKKLGEAILGGIKEAMNVEAAVQQIKRIMGESSNQFLKWSDTQAAAFNMSKSEALKYGSVFGNLLMTFTKNGSETMKYTEDLLKASSIIASATGRSMEDVMERVRSGLLGNTEAIEDLGVNVNVAMIQSTEAFKKFANGKSWDQLDFQTQQQIRLMAILEQTNKKYGDSVSQNTSTQLAQLVAQLKNVQLSLGQAFLPILQIVLPVLNQFASGLAYVMNIVAQFSQALFGKSIGNSQVQGTQAQAKAMTNLGNATEKAGKQAKGALAGFDEINSLNISSDDNSNNDSSGVSGGAASVPAMDTGGFTSSTVEISKNVQEMANKVKSVLGVIFEPFKKSWDLYGPTIMDNVHTIFNDIIEIANNVGQTIYDVWSNPAVQEQVVLLNGIFSDLFTIFTRIFDEVAKPAMLAFLELIDPSKNPVAQAFQDKIRDILAVVKDLTGYLSGDGFKYVKDFLELFIAYKAIGFVIEIGKNTAAIIENTIVTVANTGARIADKVETGRIIALYAIDAVKRGISTVATWAQVAAQTAWNAITVVGQGIMAAFNFILSLNPIFLITAAIVGVIAGLVLLYNKCEWFRDGVNAVFSSIWSFMKNVFSNVGSFFEDVWNRIRNTFTKIGSTVGDAMAGAFKAVVNSVIGFAEDTINGFIRAINGAIDLINNIPGVNIKTLNTLDIPRLARGGITNGPTMALIGDNPGGKEVVSPLNKLQDMLISAVGTAILETTQFNSARNNNTTGDIYLQIDGATLGKVLLPHIENENQRIGKSMIIQEV